MGGAEHPMHAPWSPARAAALATLATLAFLPRVAGAFHEGGAGQCDGCHSIHSTATSSLLNATDPSSVCLTCHADSIQRPYTVMTAGSAPGLAPVNYTPGGDFAWLRKTYRWRDSQGVDRTSPGDRHGHNVVAADFGLFADAKYLTAPGGTYSSAQLSCISCHDPHGRYRITDSAGTVATKGLPIRASGSYTNGLTVEEPTATSAVGVYRLLGGVGYQTKNSGQTPFSAPPPVAVAPLTYNQSERSNQVRVAYGARMSEWCANCHGEMHKAYTPGFVHPAGQNARLSASVTKIYNSYVKSGDLTGSQASSYSSLVPYEEGTTSRATLAPHARSDGSARAGPQTGLETVSCVTCHRAHASGWDHAMRWNQQSEFTVANGQWPGIDATGVAATPALAQGRTVAETRAAMYDRYPTVFATFQNSLCNKCHAK